MDTLEHLKSVEALCDKCLRNIFVVRREDMGALSALCEKKISLPKGSKKSSLLLARRYRRSATLIRILLNSESEISMIQPKIGALKKIIRLLIQNL